MKKISIILAVVIVFTVLALCLVACNPGGQGGQSHKHDFDAEWKVSESEHWHECSCGKKQDIAKHIDENGDERCDICEYNMHIHNLVNKCDDLYHWEECGCGFVNKKTEHSFEIKHNNTHHWEECKCGNIRNKVEHSFEMKNNDAHHWEECECGLVKNKSTHTDLDDDCKCDNCPYVFLEKLKSYVEFSSAFRYVDTKGEEDYWTVSAKNTEMTKIYIPSVVDGIPVKRIRSFSKCKNLKSVTLPESLETVADRAFEKCTSLTTINIPESVTNIGYNAFYQSAYYNDESNWEDGVLYVGNHAIEAQKSMDGGCKLRSGTVGIAYKAFTGCKYITSVVIPNSVKYIGDSAFAGCFKLKNVDMSNSLETIGEKAFYNASLTSITIPNSVTSIGRWAFESNPYFDNASNWQNGSLYIGNYLIKLKWDVKGEYEVKAGTTCIADGAFGDTLSIESIILPDSLVNIGNQTNLSFAPHQVNYKGDLRSWCAVKGMDTVGRNSNDFKLIIDGKEVAGELVIPDGVTRIEGGTFYSCNGITSITIPKSVTSIGKDAFKYCYVASINYAGNIAGWCEMRGVNNIYRTGQFDFKLIIAGQEVAGDLVIPEGVTRIGSAAFEFCREITSLTIPDSVTSIENEAFLFCNIRRINYAGNIAGWCAMRGVTNISRYSDFKLIIDGKEITGELVIPNSVTSIGNSAFSGCTGLAAVTIPDSVTSIGNGAFSGCTGLTSITIPNSVTSIGNGAFSGCTGLTSVTIGNSVTSIGQSAFEGCRRLTSITIPDSVTWIGSSVFSNCAPNKIEISSRNSTYYSEGNCIIEKETNRLVAGCNNSIIPNSVKYIGGSAFEGCIGLTTITIPNSVTRIGDSAFAYCRGLTSITIPDSVTLIGERVFSGCTGLQTITFDGTISQWKSIEKIPYWNEKWNNDIPNTCKVVCTDGTISIND